MLKSSQTQKPAGKLPGIYSLGIERLDMTRSSAEVMASRYDQLSPAGGGLPPLSDPNDFTLFQKAHHIFTPIYNEISQRDDLSNNGKHELANEGSSMISQLEMLIQDARGNKAPSAKNVPPQNSLMQPKSQFALDEADRNERVQTPRTLPQERLQSPGTYSQSQDNGSEMELTIPPLSPTEALHPHLSVRMGLTHHPWTDSNTAYKNKDGHQMWFQRDIIEPLLTWPCYWRFRKQLELLDIVIAVSGWFHSCKGKRDAQPCLQDFKARMGEYAVSSIMTFRMIFKATD